MLIGKNMIMIEGKPAAEYGREYFTHSSTDEVETYKKNSKGNPVKNADGKEWEGLRPVGESKAPVATLLQEALNRLVERYPLQIPEGISAEDLEKLKSDYPFRLLLKAVDYGADLWMQAEMRSKLTPAKPIDKAAGIAKLAKTLMAMNPKLTAEKANKLAIAMSEDEVEEAA